MRVFVFVFAVALLHAGCTLVTCDDICDPKAGGAGGDGGGSTAGGSTAGGGEAGGIGTAGGGAAGGATAGGEEPDGGAAGGSAGGATAGGAAGGAVVFVTSGVYHGDFDAQAIGYLGVAAADRLCNVAATNAGVSRSFRAFVSGPAISASSRLIDSSPWYLIGTNTVMFPSKASLGGAPPGPINRNQFGNPVTGTNDVWTGTTPGGLAGANCMTWSTNVMAQTGLKGTSSASFGWSSSGAAISCDNMAHLFCFEQRP